jgi:hypothetical protein
VGKPEGNRPLERLKRRWGITLKCILERMCAMDWIFLPQDRDHWRGSCEHGNELFGFHKILGNS